MIKNKKILTGELRLNGDAYTILNMIGHGGSGAVYRVLHHKSKEIQALKHVATIHLSRQTTRDYRNEINFLYQLRKKRCAHIPLLYNYKYCRSSGDLSIVLELGEIDFASYLGMQKSKPLNMNFVRWYGQQMLEAIAEIHEEHVVHRDLKPANFILKEGSLKLIDFGISKKVDRHTGTVDIDTPTGTINYMPPEAFAFVGDGPKKHTQIGLPSDIWAFGCILYQMIYGRTPFHRIPSDQKAQHICSTSIKIDYPSVVHFNPTKNKQDGGEEEEDDDDTYPTQKPSHISIGKDTVAMLQSCLERSPLLRLSAKELLEHRFFYPSSSTL
ncbi:kinase-like domain-containing protein [Absidia repens]|uniref:Kinase-like domain-containing protein n=1 Tax=Absidia repens TaxID=90262 RepID=A0A1X2IYP7_9FUNG|nr:kinase-like domain-containing protein [Absidia repens]